MTYSLSDLERANSSRFKRHLKRALVNSYDDFVDALHDDIDRVIYEMECNPQHHQGESEDRITHHIKSCLKLCGYDTTHDTSSGGHVDLTVVSEVDEQWRWIAEAKIASGVSVLREGYLQLCTRYKNPPSGNDNIKAGLLAYDFRENTKKQHEDWMASMRSLHSWKHYPSSAAVDKTVQVRICGKRPSFSFFSEHKHPSFGIPFLVRHSTISLHFAPNDKSARTSRQKKSGS